MSRCIWSKRRLQWISRSQRTIHSAFFALAINHGENRELSLQLTSEDDSAQLQTTIAIVCIKGDNNSIKWEIFSWEHFIMIDIFFKAATLGEEAFHFSLSTEFIVTFRVGSIAGKKFKKMKQCWKHFFPNPSYLGLRSKLRFWLEKLFCGFFHSVC